MKRISLLFCLLSFSASAAYAEINSTNGFYAGADVIFAIFDPVDGSATSESLMPAAGYIRPFLGYRFTDYFALEGGYNDLVNDSNAGGNNNGWGTLGPDHYRLYAVDLAGKIIYPFKSGFSLSGKAGIAYVHQNVYNQIYWDSEPSADTNADRILPLVGIGVSYNFTQHLSSNLSITYFQGVSPIGSIGTLGLGLSYTF